MRQYTSAELNIPHAEFLKLRSAGKVRLGVDEGVALKLSQTDLMPKTSSAKAATNFWSWIAIAVFGASIYFSFTGSWWWFIPGFIGMMVIHSANKKGTSQNILEIAEADPFFYEKLRPHGVWLYQMDEADAAPFGDFKSQASALVEKYAGIVPGSSGAAAP